MNLWLLAATPALRLPPQVMLQREQLASVERSLRCLPPVMGSDAKHVWISKLNEMAAQGKDFGLEVVVLDRSPKADGTVRIGVPASRAVEIARQPQTPDVRPVVVEQSIPSKKPSEEEAKRAWLARNSAPTRGSGAAVTTGVRRFASEEEAKRAWLARNSGPSWGPASTAAPQVKKASTPPQAATREQRRAWLNGLNAPKWGEAASTLADMADQATAMAVMEQDCFSGDKDACRMLSVEERNKRAWLARGVPALGMRHRYIAGTQIADME
ncbi:hypothetical protein AB1Y20_020007 [Prymnesium parvum]|uniref:Uncharacterized protein n=1 Tax=Prymnesium parvum TaxID=97485 RepID=A0AB34JWP9_PRYPA